MKICMFSRSIPEHSLGGMEHHCWIVATELAKRGHEVKLITTSSPKGKRYEEIGNLGIFYLEGTMPGRYSRDWWRKSIEAFRDLHSRHKFDIIFSESTGGLSCLKARARGEFDIPIVLRLPGTAFRDALSQLRQALSLKAALAASKNLYLVLRDRRWVRSADAVITCSDEVSKAVLKELCVPRGKIYTIPNGVDVDRFKPDIDVLNLKTRMGISIDEKIIVCVSRIKREKGIHILLEALSRIISEGERVKLIIVGQGNFEESLRRMVSKLRISEYVIFKGGVDHDELPAHYALADIFVLPTLAREGLPWAVLEAMSCARPVISSRIGGVPSIIDDGEDGLLVAPGNISELKDKLQLLLGNPDLRKCFGQRAREKIISRFNQEMMIDETLNILERYAHTTS